jgi:hypothetical protein
MYLEYPSSSAMREEGQGTKLRLAALHMLSVSMMMVLQPQL